MGDIDAEIIEIDDAESPKECVEIQLGSRRVKHRSTAPFSEGTSHRSGGLEPACSITQAAARQHWNFPTAPLLQGHVIRDEAPATTLPTYSILAAIT